MFNKRRCVNCSEERINISDASFGSDHLKTVGATVCNSISLQDKLPGERIILVRFFSDRHNGGEHVLGETVKELLHPD